MIYKVAAAMSLGLVTQSAAFSPAMTPFALQQQHRTALSSVLMNAGGGTETIDFTGGAVRPQRDVVDDQMRPRPSIDFSNLRARLEVEFGFTDEQLKQYDTLSKEDVTKAYEMMQLCRQFENACNQAYMQGNIRGFMHLDNGQEVTRRSAQPRTLTLRPTGTSSTPHADFYGTTTHTPSLPPPPHRLPCRPSPPSSLIPSRRATLSIVTTASTPTPSPLESTQAR